MPGKLKSSACCPVCGIPLIALCDETTSARVRRKFYHDKDPQDFELAQRERRALEVRRRAA